MSHQVIISKLPRRYFNRSMAHKIGRISVIAVGKIKAKHWMTAVKTYQSRLEHYTKFELKIVKDVIGQGLPDAMARQREGEQLLQAVSQANRIILLSAEGDQNSSPQLAGYLQNRLETYGHLSFLIGGPTGFSDEVIEVSHENLSLSRLTLPHELARVVLLEQLYRAFTILNGEKYHK